MRRRTSWREKLNDAKGLPVVQPMDDRLSRKWGAGTIAIPAPIEVDAIMRQVPEGKLITINGIRERVANKHGATIACPITCGIFAWIAAHAAEEAAAEGAKDITAYWRTLKTGGELNAKYPGGIDHLKSRLEAEGHTVIAKGKKWFVKDFAGKII